MEVGEGGREEMRDTREMEGELGRDDRRDARDMESEVGEDIDIRDVGGGTGIGDKVASMVGLVDSEVTISLYLS